jgi:hypothetical protein
MNSTPQITLIPASYYNSYDAPAQTMGHHLPQADAYQKLTVDIFTLWEFFILTFWFNEFISMTK